MLDISPNLFLAAQMYVNVGGIGFATSRLYQNSSTPLHPRVLAKISSVHAKMAYDGAAAHSHPPVSAQETQPTSMHDHYYHDDHLDPYRWNPKECHRYLEDRPWADVLKFYSQVAIDRISLSDLIFLGQAEHAGSKKTYHVKNGPPAAATTPKNSLKELKGGKWERITYKIVLSYDGSAFIGWQRQPGLLTVQGVLEQALGRFVDGKRAASLEAEGVPVEAAISVAGRTDKGVHAAGQVCSFYTWQRGIKSVDIETLINRLAPQALRVVNLEQVSRTFHPNFSAQWRRYVYILPLHDLEIEGTHAQENSTATPSGTVEISGENKDGRDSKIPRKPERFDVVAVNELLSQLEGQPLSYTVFARDTKTSRSRGAPTECIIYHARAAVAELPMMDDVFEKERRRVMCVELVANRFLRKMVRVLVATSIREAAAGAPRDGLLRLMGTTCRRATAPPAPACGLCLAEVSYNDFSAANLLIN